MAPFRLMIKLKDVLSPPTTLKTVVNVKLLRTDWIFRGKTERDEDYLDLAKIFSSHGNDTMYKEEFIQALIEQFW